MLSCVIIDCCNFVFVYRLSTSIRMIINVISKKISHFSCIEQYEKHFTLSDLYNVLTILMKPNVLIDFGLEKFSMNDKHGLLTNYYNPINIMKIILI